MKLINNIVISLIILNASLVNSASAGLIHNGYEWLDLDVTQGMSKSQVENTILNQGQYQGYQYASTAMVNDLYIDLITGSFDWTDANAGWRSLSNLSDAQEDIFDYFSGGYSIDASWAINGLSTDKYAFGWLFTESPDSHNGTYSAGHRNLVWDSQGSNRQVFDRNIADNTSLASPVEWISFNNENSAYHWASHALVKVYSQEQRLSAPLPAQDNASSIAEPSMLIVFSIALLTLVRFGRKQSF